MHAGTLSVNLRREPPILKLPSHLLTRDGSISQANDRWPVIHERKRDEIAALEKTRLQALGSRGRKKERVRKRETREGRGSACLEGPRKSFQLAFCAVRIFPIG